MKSYTFFLLVFALNMHLRCFSQNRDYGQEFERLNSLQWKEVFSDSGIDDWQKKWMLDGIQAKVENSANGMTLIAGTKKSDANHAVLWIKERFSGDVKIEYDYIRVDSSKANTVNIIYIQAQGSGKEGFDRNIFKWSDKRQHPAMRVYFDHMDTYHISYASDGVSPAIESENYIKGRRYMPERMQGLNETNLTPEYLNVNLFKPGSIHHITIIKSGSELYFKVENNCKSQVFYFDGRKHPPIDEGYIGFRHMYTRSATYSNIKVLGLELQ